MSERLKKWLSEQLIGLVGVQQCVVNPAGGIVSRSYPVDLRVLLWTGVIVNIYVLEEIPKPRTIRGIVHHDTGQGMGVMFIVAPHLVPAPRARFSPPEWLMALHALNHERIYTYAPEDREMALMQIHFERVDATELYEAIYGPEVVMDRLHYGRVAVKPRMLKGYWLTGHFGMASFWQNERKNFYMPPPRQHKSTSADGHQAANPASDASETNSRREKTRLEISYEILGVHMNASEDEVKTAFRRQVFSVHPDVSALPKMMAEERFRILAEAYEYIKAERGWG
ncbi:MAG TPA: DnaJ domain-containing protein [Spirillospora sp.]|nr:DnaJ domain-containing protein [Spirillospora sp.]